MAADPNQTQATPIDVTSTNVTSTNVTSTNVTSIIVTPTNVTSNASDNSDNDSVVYIAVGVSTFVLVAVLVVVGICLYRKCRKRTREGEKPPPVLPHPYDHVAYRPTHRNDLLSPDDPSENVSVGDQNPPGDSLSRHSLVSDDPVSAERPSDGRVYESPDDEDAELYVNVEPVSKRPSTTPAAAEGDHEAVYEDPGGFSLPKETIRIDTTRFDSQKYLIPVDLTPPGRRSPHARTPTSPTSPSSPPTSPSSPPISPSSPPTSPSSKHTASSIDPSRLDSQKYLKPADLHHPSHNTSPSSRIQNLPSPSASPRPPDDAEDPANFVWKPTPKIIHQASYSAEDISEEEGGVAEYVDMTKVEAARRISNQPHDVNDSDGSDASQPDDYLQPDEYLPPPPPCKGGSKHDYVNTRSEQHHQSQHHESQRDESERPQSAVYCNTHLPEVTQDLVNADLSNAISDSQEEEDGEDGLYMLPDEVEDYEVPHCDKPVNVFIPPIDETPEESDDVYENVSVILKDRVKSESTSHESSLTSPKTHVNVIDETQVNGKLSNNIKPHQNNVLNHERKVAPKTALKSVNPKPIPKQKPAKSGKPSRVQISLPVDVSTDVSSPCRPDGAAVDEGSIYMNINNDQGPGRSPKDWRRSAPPVGKKPSPKPRKASEPAIIHTATSSPRGLFVQKQPDDIVTKSSTNISSTDRSPTAKAKKMNKFGSNPQLENIGVLDMQELKNAFKSKAK